MIDMLPSVLPLSHSPIGDDNNFVRRQSCPVAVIYFRSQSALRSWLQLLDEYVHCNRGGDIRTSITFSQAFIDELFQLEKTG